MFDAIFGGRAGSASLAASAGAEAWLRPPRVMTSTTSKNATAGHAEMHRAMADGSAASTLAITEATTPVQNAAHADQRLRRPSPRATVATTIIPSTEIGSRSAISSACPYRKARPRMWEYEASAAIAATTSAPGREAPRRQVLGRPG